MKSNSLKFAKMFDLIQLNFDAIDLSNIGVRSNIFANTFCLPVVVKELAADDSILTHIDRENSSNCKLQKHRLERRHHSIDWRWQFRLLKWFDRSLWRAVVGGL